MEWLKKLLETHGAGAELVTAIMDATKDQQYIPKSRFDEVNENLKDAKKQITERDKQITDLGEKAKGNEDLQKQIADLTESNKKQLEETQDKTKKMSIKWTLDKELEGCKYKDLVEKQYDLSGVEFDDDFNLKNPDFITNQTKGFKETTYKDFWEQTLTGTSPANNGGSTPQANPLQKQLEEAQKAGNTAMVVSLTQKMYEQQQQNNNI